VEVPFKIWDWLTETFGPLEATLIFVAGMVLWGMYWHILRPSLNTLGEWYDFKLRQKLSMPAKSPPPSK